MKGRKRLALVLAGLMFLTACQAAPPPSGTKPPAEESAPSLSEPTPAEQEEEQKEREEYPLEPRSAPPAEVRVGFVLREYHDLNCMAEIPRLEARPDAGEIPGLWEANAPFRELERRWREYRALPEHETTPAAHRENFLLIQSYPYSDSRWAQVVVQVRPTENGDWSGYKVISVNWDLQERRAVSPEEMLGRLGLTQEDLLAKLGRVDSLSVDVFHDPYSVLIPQVLTVQAFRGREDGSAVFYSKVDCVKQRLNDHREVEKTEAAIYNVAYDTRDGVFRNVVEDLLRKWEPVELPQTDDPPLRWQADVQSPIL